MAERWKKLERELGLPAAPLPFPTDPKAINRRVERTLSAGEKEKSMYQRYRVRTAALLTAAAVAMTGGALAAGPTLGEMLQRALGDFAPFAQAQEGVAEDEGIRVKVVSALADQTTLRVYAEITDLTGDRLEGARIDGDLQIQLEGESSFISSSNVVDYDSGTGTALVCFSRYSGAPIPTETQAWLKITGIQPGYHSFWGDAIPLDLIPEGYAPEQVLESGETVLLPGGADYLLTGEESEGVVISSVGFATDGRLHVLFRFPGAAARGEGIVTVFSKAELEGETGGQFCRDYQDVTFTVDGVTYHDHAVAGTPEDREDIGELAYPGGTFVSGEKVEGIWEVPVTVKRVEDVSSPLSGTVDHSQLRELVLSPYGIILRSQSPDGTQLGGYPLTVFLSDGTTLRPERSHTGGGDFDSGLHQARWEFDAPVEVEDITGVALGCWMIPVESGRAGEGCWLVQLPE